MNILRYVLVDKDNYEGDHEYTDIDEARTDAEDRAEREGTPWAVVERVYTYEDSNLVYTTNQSDVWP